MTTREKTYAISGALAGLLIAAIAFVAIRPLPVPAAPQTAAVQSAAPVDHSQHAAPTAATTAGAVVQLTAAEQKSIGLELTPVTRRALRNELLAPGRVDDAETSLSTISARVAGRIDKLYLDFTGQPVRRGQPVASIYSPDLLTAAQEYKLALESRARLRDADAETRAHADDLVAASRRKLELWGLSAQQVDELGAGGSAVHLTTYATTSGVVKERRVTAGQYVQEGEALFTVSDLSRVWVLADFYQSDVPSLRAGAPVDLTSDALPGQTLRGRVAFLEPAMNADTRTIVARIEVPNPDLRLRPGMFVAVRLAAPGRTETLVVPRSAVLDTGTRSLVYVARDNGEFAAREVQLGAPAGDFYPVLSGLNEGDRVVTQGAFMLDSQTRLTGGMSGLYGGAKEYDNGKPRPNGHGDHATPASPPPTGYKLHFESHPPQPKSGAPAHVVVHLTGPDGKPVRDAEVAVTFVMPAMPAMNMPEMKATAALQWDGMGYSGMASLALAGPWNVTAVALRDGRPLAQHRTRITAQ